MRGFVVLGAIALASFLLAFARSRAAAGQRIHEPTQVVRVRATKWFFAFLLAGACSSVFVFVVACLAFADNLIHGFEVGVAALWGSVTFAFLSASALLYVMLELCRAFCRVYEVSDTRVVMKNGDSELWSNLSRVDVPDSTRIRVLFRSGRQIDFRDFMHGWGYVCELLLAVAPPTSISEADVEMVRKIIRERLR